MDRVRIGVVGLRFGQQHVRTLANMPEAHLVAVADRRPEVPGGLDVYAAHYGARPYADAVEMLEREELDAISLCIAPAGREPLLELAASKGIALFVEKPWAMDLDHAQRLAALCRRHQATVMAAFSFRFLPAMVRLRELMDGELGQGWLLNGEYVFGWTPPAGHWLWDPHNGNGFFNENSCHLFDAVCHLMGDPVAVTAEAINPMGAPSENAAAVTVRFADGGIAALTLGGIGAGAVREFPRLDVVTANGQACLAGREHIWDQLTWCTRGDDSMQRLIRPPESLGNTRYTYALRHFCECIRSGRPPSATVEHGVRAVALAMGVLESIRTGCRVPINW